MCSFTSSSLCSFAFLWNILNSLRISGFWNNLLWITCDIFTPLPGTFTPFECTRNQPRVLQKFSSSSHVYVAVSPDVIYRLATSWTVREPNLGGGEFSAHVQTSPGANPALYTMDTGSFPWVKLPERVVDHPHRALTLKKG